MHHLVGEEQYSFDTRGDQILNAQSFEKQGFSVVLPQEKMTVETLVQNVKKVYENKDAMKRAMKEKAPQDAIEKIVELIEKEVSPEH
jgi:UDP-N-acetylglucosamine--N-acetylmuramyl-(pentapeptide) pyrophosphoryl-undecaprenol N-acetylglucosamine transferase